MAMEEKELTQMVTSIKNTFHALGTQEKIVSEEELDQSKKMRRSLVAAKEMKIGDILTSLLPAGSITGTPKKKTVEILDKIENYDRGYFTGIFGVFDGEKLDSSVIIRYIEKDTNKKNQYTYKSGGGITSDSDVHKEYQEMCDKVYIP